MRCYAITHTGLVREGNEDSFFIPERGECFAVVCDGMGGHKAGEVASALAISALRRELRGAMPGCEMLRSAILMANADVYARSQDDEECAGMGTTLTAIWWTPERIYVGHVGDSRLYRYSNEHLRQLTRDHTYVQELVERGSITPRQARTHPRRNEIMRSVGTRPAVEVDTFALERKPGEIYLLCSDGLTTMVEDGKLEDILRQGTPAAQLDAMLSDALRGGGYDNITALLAYDGEGEK